MRFTLQLFLVYSNQVDELHSLDDNFVSALKNVGEIREVTKPKRQQTSLETELFSVDVDTENDESQDEPDELGAGAEEVAGGEDVPEGEAD